MGESRIWGVRPFPGPAAERIPIGPLSLWLKADGDELRVAHSLAADDAPGAPASSPSDAPPEDRDLWTRFAFREAPERIALRPGLPDRPIVVEPEVRFHLLPHARARIHVRVPLSARVTTEESEGAVTLLELPTRILSDTWWGELHAGELCYWQPISARRHMAVELPEHVCLATVELQNRAEHPLPVERIALRTEHLSLFRTERGIFTDTTQVVYEAHADGSRIKVSGRAPEAAGESELLAEARVSASRALRARTFQRLRGLSSMGLG